MVSLFCQNLQLLLSICMCIFSNSLQYIFQIFLCMKNPSTMKITVKQLQGGECAVEVFPNTMISEIKQQIAFKLRIPVDDQKLLLLGRTLADEQTIESYPNIKDGTKLNLVVKKPENFFEAAVKHFKNLGMTEKEAIDSGNKLLKVVDEKVNQMSWDDIDRLCYNILLEESGEKPLAEQDVSECDDSFGL